MQKYFPGFYYSGQDNLFSFLNEDSSIVPDAYLLLDLFRISEGKKFVELLQIENIKKYLWIPYDSVWLYHQLMHSVLIEQINKVKSTLSYLISFNESVKNKYTHPYIGDKLMKKTDQFIKEIKAKLDLELTNLVDTLQNKNNSIVSSIDKLFPEDKIGTEYSPTELNQLFDEAAKRYAAETPPGYLYDASCQNRRIRYHDYIVWNEMQKRVIGNNKRNIVFITNRIRPDWFFIYDKDVLGPRKELIDEFKRKSQGDIHIVTTYNFVSEVISYYRREEEYEKLLEQLPNTPIYQYDTQMTEKGLATSDNKFGNAIG